MQPESQTLSKCRWESHKEGQQGEMSHTVLERAKWPGRVLKGVTFTVTPAAKAVLELVQSAKSQRYSRVVDPRTSFFFSPHRLHPSTLLSSTTCPLVRKQAQESFPTRRIATQRPSTTTHPPQRRTPPTPPSEPLSRSADPPIPRPSETASRPRQPPLAQEAPFHHSINKAISTSTDTSALYVSHTQRKRPQTPAASRAATISHTAETL
ncbi:hypothetical protein N431DRAFT_73616 [Stipitochalara longipes BDJ]|nr:hypothetical protein N431DRAFT_73616 [Stipitochalara longipes BDJ]